jgi:hypothetical protein
MIDIKEKLNDVKNFGLLIDTENHNYSQEDLLRLMPYTKVLCIKLTVNNNNFTGWLELAAIYAQFLQNPDRYPVIEMEPELLQKYIL